MTSRQQYLNNLPKKISSVGALFYNIDWGILFLAKHPLMGNIKRQLKQRILRSILAHEKNEIFYYETNYTWNA